jgi:hypothetical protein
MCQGPGTMRSVRRMPFPCDLRVSQLPDGHVDREYHDLRGSAASRAVDSPKVERVSSSSRLTKASIDGPFLMIGVMKNRNKNAASQNPT